MRQIFRGMKYIKLGYIALINTGKVHYIFSPLEIYENLQHQGKGYSKSTLLVWGSSSCGNAVKKVAEATGMLWTFAVFLIYLADSSFFIFFNSIIVRSFSFYIHCIYARASAVWLCGLFANDFWENCWKRWFTWFFVCFVVGKVYNFEKNEIRIFCICVEITYIWKILAVGWSNRGV